MTENHYRCGCPFHERKGRIAFWLWVVLAIVGGLCQLAGAVVRYVLPWLGVTL